ncbi:hypothetical protein T069G_06942 [Trichoderma breve]|uniref:Uncharacterized protein n=1 Tax=Trichoderma breve TaxID=2034170 RepID=A0A9W9BE35_9HYPO|nr:hypothetical protein T069G_06942 [Trichoderma breve]KAJ4858675.1 hypothetical protein T069G_06942 [Trichoderma breve]
METKTQTISASPQKSHSSTPLRRKKARRYHKTSPKKRTPTPRSSPYRCSKSPRKVNQPLMRLWGDEDDGERLVYSTILDSMEEEKRRYLGSQRWNELEERLFEILFLRQEIPLLPLHWEVDFRGVPVSGDLFCWREGVKPIVYAHTSGLGGFRATSALTRLIDLTANVRTTCQSGLRQKVPQKIKKALDNYLSWAAEDGGYSHLKYTPNTIVEVVDRNGEGSTLAAFIETRMRELARAHRELLAIKTDEGIYSTDMDVDKEVDTQIKTEAEASVEQQSGGRRSRSWRTFGSRIMSRLFQLLRRPVIKPESHGETSVINSGDDEPKTRQGNDHARSRVYVKREEEEEIAIKPELFDNSDDDITMADIPMASTTTLHLSAPPTSYIRPPPVVFGFFIVATSVILLTTDASKEDADMIINFHVDMDFQNRSLGVWNALTVAIATCLARDDMMKRMGDFEEEGVVEESDPDA